MAGGGALLGTGAFTTVTAERTVSVETAGDASAFLQLVPATENDNDNGAYASQEDGTITIELDGDATTEGGSGLNQNAKTTIRDIVQVTNNGTDPITNLNLTMTDSSGNTLTNTISFTSDADTSTTYNHGENILGDNLGTGNSVEFGIVVDLIDNSLPDSSPYNLTIEALTDQSQSS
ncbi:hypothetical protein EXE43_21310 [Halorubrum sp. SS5]|nr:hypothetical protein EXE43_21310 [Halorubrum sp. SS5]